MQLYNFKGFENFTLRLGSSTSVLVGPNNAGKSTAIAALRLCAQLISHAKQRKPEFVTRDMKRDRSIHAYRLNSVSSGFVDENVAYEFRNIEARIEVQFKNKAALYVVWPVDEGAPYFYLEQIPGAQPPSIKVVKTFYPSIGVVQTLTPVEHRETVLSEKHVRDNLGTRLASKHFRNQLYQFQLADPAGYDEFKEYLVENTPDVSGIELVASSITPELHLYFNESVSRVEKEISWAGDGIQIWFQLLFHLWRHRGVGSLILDEPDVYLHPDLQRRLVKALESVDSQVILATHAPEILAESNRDTVVLIDRTRRSSKRMGGDLELSELNRSLGSGFNLRLAKVLRSRSALFVEGNDMKLLSNIAKTIGASKFHREDGLTVVPMGGASRRKLAESFGFLNSTILESAVKVSVILDRDFMSDSDASDLIGEFAKNNVTAHIWKRNEIESYLVSASAISRLSGISVADVDRIIADAVERLKERAFAQVLCRENEVDRPKGINISNTYHRTRSEFDANWAGVEWRSGIVPGKDLLSYVNGRLQDAGGKAASARGLSYALKAYEIPMEMQDVISGIERELA